MFLLQITAELEKKNILYAVVGGYAVALHGAVRGTLDVDLIISCTESAYIGCETALKSMGLQPRLPVTGQQVFQFRKEYIQKRNLKAWSFYDPKDPSRLVDIIITFGKKKIPTKQVTIRNKKVSILAKQELIRMKKQASRPQDLEDIRALEKLT